MSRPTYFHRAVVGILIILAGMVFESRQATAQFCVCPTTLLTTKRVTICFNGAFQQVDVTYCNENYCPPMPPATPDPCDPPNDPINARTVIYQICPIGFATADAQNLMNATIAAMGLCCGDQAGLFNCTAGATRADWIVRWPKCVQFDATGCLVACAGSPCCGFRVAFFPGNPAGLCETLILDNCSDPTSCTSSTCTELQCFFPTQCCW